MTPAADVVVSSLVRFPNLDGVALLIHARAPGSWQANTGAGNWLPPSGVSLRVDRADGTDSLTVSVHHVIAGTSTQLATATVSTITAVSTRTLAVEFSATAGVLEGRVWDSTGTSPASPTVTATSSVTTAGVVQVAELPATAVYTPVELQSFTVTGSSPATGPITVNLVPGVVGAVAQDLTGVTLSPATAAGTVKVSIVPAGTTQVEIEAAVNWSDATLIAGGGLRAVATFVHPDTLAATDPTFVEFKVAPPKQQAQTYVYGTDAAVVRVSQGVYRLDFTGTKAGAWQVQARGTGNGLNTVGLSNVSLRRGI